MKRTFTKYPSKYVKASDDPQSTIEYRGWPIHYNVNGNGKYSVGDFEGVDEFVEDFDTLEDAQSYVDYLIKYHAALEETKAEELGELQEEI